MSNEADARIIIDRLLREADWDIEDKAQVVDLTTSTSGQFEILRVQLDQAIRRVFLRIKPLCLIVQASGCN
jgi:hypothetical protein